MVLKEGRIDGINLRGQAITRGEVADLIGDWALSLVCDRQWKKWSEEALKSVGNGRQ